MYELPLLAGMVAWVWYWVIGRDRRKSVKRQAKEFNVGHEEWQTNKKLWDLLKDEDPAWLMAMGIEEPKQYQEEREKKAENKRRYERDKLLAMKPLTAAAYGGSFDRDVERELERRLQQQVTPETLRGMSTKEKAYAAQSIMAQLQGQDAAAQQAMEAAEYEHQRRLQQQRGEHYARGMLGSALVDSMGGLGSLYVDPFGRH